MLRPPVRAKGPRRESVTAKGREGEGTTNSKGDKKGLDSMGAGARAVESSQAQTQGQVQGQGQRQEQGRRGPNDRWVASVWARIGDGPSREEDIDDHVMGFALFFEHTPHVCLIATTASGLGVRVDVGKVLMASHHGNY